MGQLYCKISQISTSLHMMRFKTFLVNCFNLFSVWHNLSLISIAKRLTKLTSILSTEYSIEKDLFLPSIANILKTNPFDWLQRLKIQIIQLIIQLIIHLSLTTVGKRFKNQFTNLKNKLKNLNQFKRLNIQSENIIEYAYIIRSYFWQIEFIYYHWRYLLSVNRQKLQVIICTFGRLYCKQEKMCFQKY